VQPKRHTHTHRHAHRQGGDVAVLINAKAGQPEYPCMLEGKLAGRKAGAQASKELDFSGSKQGTA